MAAIEYASNYGATNGADNTTEIQAALTAAGVGGTTVIDVPGSTLSATLYAPSNAQIRGRGINSTSLTRTGNYGDTLVIGSATPGQHAGAFLVEGMLFDHGTAYTPGTTNLNNLVTSGAHIKAIQGQQGYIEKVWTNRMKYGIQLDGGSTITLKNVTTHGVWDMVNAGCQETWAGVFLDATNTNPTLINLDDCQIAGGAGSASRTYTYTCSNGNSNRTGSQSVGFRFGVFTTGCEGLKIGNGSYFGGASHSNIFLAPIAGRNSSMTRISDCFFDSAGGPGGVDIYFHSQDANIATGGVAVTGNTFNGENYGQHAIFEGNGANLAKPALDSFYIGGNTFNNYVGTPIWMYAASNGVIGPNKFTNYNSLGIGTTDPAYINKVYLGGNCSNITQTTNV